MKKSSIPIAMFAIIAATCTVQAELNVNFDGNLKPQTMHDIFAAAHQIAPAAAFPTRALQVEESPVDVRLKMRGLKPESGKALYSLLDERQLPLISQEIVEQVRDGEISVLYNTEKAYFTKTKSDNTRILVLESRDQSLLGMIRKASRAFPETRWDNPDGVPTGVGNKLCAEYVTNEVCQNRKVCRVVTAAGGSYGGLLGAVVGAVAGEYVCEWIPECSTVQTCIRWE